MARTKATAKVTGKESATKAKVPAKPSTKVPAKAPAKVQAKAPAKSTSQTAPKTAAPAKGSAKKVQPKAPPKAKPVAKSLVKPKAKPVAKEEPVATDDYSSLKLPELKELLKERGLDVKGNKGVLVARLQEHDENPPSETSDEPLEEPSEEPLEEPSEEPLEEEQEVVEEKPKPVKVKKAAAGTAKKATATKAVAAKGKKPPAKKTEEFPDVSIPDVTYALDAKTLSTIIHQTLNDTGTRQAFFEKLYKALDDYVSSPEEEESEIILEEPEVITEKPVTTEKPKMILSFDEDIGAFVDPSGTYLVDPATQAVFAKITDDPDEGKRVDMLEDSDLQALSRVRVYEDEAGVPLVSRPEEEFGPVLEKLLQNSREFRDQKPAAKVLKKVEKLAEEPKEGPEEGEDDGKEVVIEEEKEETDVVGEVETEEKELTSTQSDIDEATFSKFLQAQHSGDVNKTDYVAISKKAGLPPKVGEQIILQYKLLSDQYPQAAIAARAKKIAPVKQSLLKKKLPRLNLQLVAD